jgi:hypothetical protein
MSVSVSGVSFSPLFAHNAGSEEMAGDLRSLMRNFTLAVSGCDILKRYFFLHHFLIEGVVTVILFRNLTKGKIVSL